MRLGNGAGSVIKMHGKRRRPYAAVITTGWIQIFDDDGVPVGKPKQQRKYIGYFSTRKEAQKALFSYNDQTPAEDENGPKSALKYVPTMEQLWREVKTIRGAQWTRTTANNYARCFQKCERIHGRRIDTITYADLQKLMNDFMSEGRTAGSLKLYKVFFSLCFGEAVKLGYIASSPAQYVTYKATAEKQQKNVIPDAIIKNVFNSRCRTRDAVLILCYTGMRINELLSLKPEQVHENYLIAGSKTAAGKGRMIPIHPFIADMVKVWAKTQHPKYARLTMLLSEDCKTYGMEFTFHECRHTFITNCNKYGVDLYALKKIVGHATSDITEGVYTHIQIDTLMREICKLPASY